MQCTISHAVQFPHMLDLGSFFFTDQVLSIKNSSVKKFINVQFIFVKKLIPNIYPYSRPAD